MFSDGSCVAVVTTNSAGDNFVARFYSSAAANHDATDAADAASASSPLMSCVNELPLKLARKCVEAVGAPFVEDVAAAPAAARAKRHQVPV
jgi:hypothetical protein